MRNKSNVSMDMIKVFTAPRHKDMPLNYHIICMMCAYYYYKSSFDILGLRGLWIAHFKYSRLTFCRVINPNLLHFNK